MTALAIFVSSCEKEGKPAIVPIKDLRPTSFSGFVMGDTLEQYFDGVSIREYFGRVRFSGKIAFESEKPIKMELKKKSTGEVLYTRSFENNPTAEVPLSFFYDGEKLTEKYTYPADIEGLEQIAFFLDFPEGTAADIAYGDGSDVNSVIYLARNVQPKQWSEFIKIPPLEGEMYVFLLKAGKNEYLIDNDVNYSYMNSGLQLPNKYGYQGGTVQSWYVGMKADSQGKTILFPQEDLVRLFPR